MVVRVPLWLLALLSVVGACTSILDFDGYEYVDPPGQGGTSTNGSSTGGGTTSSSAAMATSSSVGGAGGGMSCDSHLECLLNQYCDPNAGCLPDKALGDACNDNEECPDDDCEDNVCCEGECEGNCRACNLQGSEGMCTLVPAGQDPNNDCPTGVCDGLGNCI